MTKSLAYKMPVNKALARRAVVVVRIDPRSFEIRSRKDGELIATVRSVQGKKGKAYSYKLVKHGDPAELRVHKGFSSLGAVVDRVLKKV